MRVGMILLILLLVFLQFELWFQSGGIVDTIRLKHTVAQQMKENDLAYERNQLLVEKIERLKHVKDIVASQAREQAGMIKDGEQYYQLVETKNTLDEEKK